MTPQNEVILAAAGSGKTEQIACMALERSHHRVLITTYTNRNAAEITTRIRSKCGLIPPRIHILTWFEFLLRHGIRPYQRALSPENITRSLNFVSQKPRYVPKANWRRYYYDDGGNVYRDQASELVTHLNTLTEGAVLRRLQAIYDTLLVDEVQDLAGYDLDVMNLLLGSAMSVGMVGDPRQCTYTTNRSQKNRPFRQAGLSNWVEQQKRRGLVCVRHMSVSFRCTAPICLFADALYPDYPATTSGFENRSEHDGVFWVRPTHVHVYNDLYSPKALRWDRSSRLAELSGLPCENIGSVKGCSFDRVLIFATEPMVRYLRSGNLDEAGQLAKLYVAVTRARYSVAFVVEAKKFSSSIAREWAPEHVNAASPKTAATVTA